MTLTARQSQMLYGLAAGMTMSHLAYRMKVSPRTAGFHRRALGVLLGVRDGNIVLVLRAAVQKRVLESDVLGWPMARLLAKVRSRA